MYKKRFLSMMLAAAFGLSLTAVANAAPAGGANAGVHPSEYANSSDTVIGIAETKVDTGNLSVEIPLYVTMVVVDDNVSAPKILVPGNYYIKNSATTANGAAASSDIYVGVSGMTFEKLQGSTYNTVASTQKDNMTGQGVGKLYLELGQVAMPEMNTPGVADVDITATENAFYDFGADGAQDGSDDTINTVAGGQKIDVGIVAQIDTTADYQAAFPNTGANENNTVAQFKVKYTVSAFDKQGNRIAATYVGDDSVQAGLGEWNEQSGTWDTTVFDNKGTNHTA